MIIRPDALSMSKLAYQNGNATVGVVPGSLIL